jgi:hypothetical protein
MSLSGPTGPTGPTGATGAAGTINTSTLTTLNGYIYGNGTTIAGATAATSAATANTLVMRSSTGNASFNQILLYDPSEDTSLGVFVNGFQFTVGSVGSFNVVGQLSLGEYIWQFPSENGNVAITNKSSIQSWSGNQTFSGSIAITNATASTSTSTGALVVSGGVGIGGALYVSNSIVAGGTVTFTSTTSRPTSAASGTPEATSLMTRDDVDAAAFDNFGRTIQVIGASYGNTGTGASAGTSYPSYIADIRTGTTANAYARATINRSLNQAAEITGVGINFSLPSAIAVRLMLNLSDTIHKLRLVVGGNGGVPATADNDALAVVGYGFEVGLNASNFLTIASFRHNGTTFVKATPTVTTLTNSTHDDQFLIFVLTNNGSGTITTEMKSGRTVLFTSTQTGGPTTSGISANSYVDLVAVNGASSAAQIRCSLQNAMIRLY